LTIAIEPSPSDAAGWIWQLVVTGRFTPGQRLPPERELAMQLGVSRSTVREGIRELVALNILVTRPGAGTYVTELSTAELFAPLHFALRVDPPSLLHLFELRRILEPVAASVAATRLDDDAIAGLKDLVEDAKQRFQDGDVQGLVQADERIHDEITDAMRNPLISAVIRSLRDLSHQSRELTASVPGVRGQTVDELESLVAALAARDPLRAEAAMIRHLSRLEDAARKAIGA
jgi:DNA-binding FadR family transcriptional regulator